MAALSFNSANLKSSSPAKKFFTCVMILIIFGVGGTAGYFGNNKLQARRTEQINKAGKDYVTAIVAGDLDKAYAMSATSLHDNQTKEEFTNTLKDLKSDKAIYADEEVSLSNRNISYVVVVDNLPPNDEGRTDGIFVMNLVNENGWKVKNIDVQ
jgi:hypothetical protein